MRGVTRTPPFDIVILRAAKDLLLACCATLLLAAPLTAQTLARPGWAGSGLASESWWRNAVFYRIAVNAFQDSDGDGIGDIPGLTQRLDYVQSLGVDAIVISPADDEEEAFSNLLREASGRRIRIVVALSDGSTDIVGHARLWLTRGAAGIMIEGAFNNPSDGARAHLRELRALVNSFPGERVLIARPYGKALITEGNTAQLVGQIIDLPAWIFTPEFRSSLLEAPSVPLPAGSAPMLQTGDRSFDPRLRKIIAAKLLTSPGAAAFHFGEELGSMRPLASVAGSPMQWTPTNITPPQPKPAADEPAKPAAPTDPNVYTAFKPYVAPKAVPKPPPPGAVPPIPVVDPNSLPGFTSGKLTQLPNANGDIANVALEDADPLSLLNFYRRLVQLHHGNSSLRTGTTFVFNHDAEKAMVWMRRAPAGSRTAANVIIACNPTDKLLTLTLDADLAHLHIRSGTLRPLLASWTAAPIAQDSGHIVLPPNSVFIGELYH